MASTPGIELLKSRDFGDQLGITFSFLRENFRLLMKCVLFIAGPAVVLASAVGGYAFANVFGLSEGSSVSVSMGLLAGLILLIAFGLLTTVVNEYVVLYAERGYGGFDFDDVWEETRRDVGKVISTTLILYICIIISVFFFLIPAIYLVVVTAPIITVRLNEKIGIGEAFSRSMELVKGQWWLTAGIMVVMSFIAGFVRNIFNIPIWIAAFMEGMAASSGDVSGEMSWTLVAGSVIVVIGSFLTALLPILASALHYFNLVEKFEGLGLMSRIESIGSSNNSESIDAGSF